MNVRPSIVRTRTPVPVHSPVVPEVFSLRSEAMPGRTIRVKRTDGIHLPLLQEDLRHLSRVHFREGRVQHFCSYIGDHPARYDAVLEPLRQSDV